MLGAYVFCVVVLIACMIGGIALAAGGTTLDVLKEPIKETMTDYDTTNPEDPVTAAWDDIQTEYECCGVDGPKDWTEFAGLSQVPNR